MITETGLLDELNLLSNTGWKRWTGTPCHWDRTTGSFSIRPRAFLTCGLVLTFGFLSHLGHVLQTVKATGSWNVLQGEDAILIFFMHGFFLVIYFTFGIFLESELMENVFNEMVRFERSHILNDDDPRWKAEMKRRPMVRLARLTCQMFRITAVEMLPVVVAGGTLLAPRFPMNILTCYPLKLLIDGLDLLEPMVPFIGVPLKMGLISLGNLLLWKFAMKYWAFLLAQIAIGSTSISSSILAFERKASSRQPGNFLLVHRQIQIMTYLFNKLDSNTLVLLLVIMCNAQIFSGLYLLWDMPVFIKAFTAITLINSMAAVVLIFGFCAEVHDTSAKCLKRLALRAGGMSSYKAKQHRRVMRSLPLVKVSFGGMNFIEKLTPVVFQEFLTERFVDTVLLSK